MSTNVSQSRDTAIVLGASIAGLLAARVLADFTAPCWLWSVTSSRTDRRRVAGAAGRHAAHSSRPADPDSGRTASRIPRRAGRRWRARVERRRPVAAVHHFRRRSATAFGPCSRSRVHRHPLRAPAVSRVESASPRACHSQRGVAAGPRCGAADVDPGARPRDRCRLGAARLWHRNHMGGRPCRRRHRAGLADTAISRGTRLWSAAGRPVEGARHVRGPARLCRAGQAAGELDAHRGTTQPPSGIRDDGGENDVHMLAVQTLAGQPAPKDRAAVFDCLDGIAPHMYWP